jgi:cytidyltransferase-like protein
MIVDSRGLSELARKVVMVDGSFDPLHDGHIAYFAEAAALGMPVLCNIAPDSWTQSKHRILLPQAVRAVVIDAIRYVSYVHASELTTNEVLQLLKPRMYVKGNDWLARGGIPATEQATCTANGIEVVYVDTVRNSSSRILRDWTATDD